MKFLVLVAGIVLTFTAAGFFVINHSIYAACLIIAGLAVVAGEGFKIAIEKQVAEAKLEEEEEKLKEDMVKDGIAKS